MDLFQMLHSPGIFAFCSMAQNRELILANGLILQSTKYWIRFWRFVWLKCTRCPCWASWSVHWTSSQRSCCHLEHCFPGEGEAEHCWGGPFVTLFDVQRRYIWFYSQNMSVPFSWHNCCAEVILPRCLMLLENKAGYALKAYFCSRVKAERADCFLVFWMFLCRLSCKCRKNVEG